MDKPICDQSIFDWATCGLTCQFMYFV